MVCCASKNGCMTSCKCILLSLVVLILLAIGGGLILWQFVLPDEDKQAINTIVDNGIPFAQGTGTDDNNQDGPPPPNFVFDHLCQFDDSKCCNGIPGLCDFRINEIMYAGVHNAQSNLEDGFLLGFNHEYSPQYALDYGYRVLNMDIGNCNGELSLVHGHCRFGTTNPTRVFTDIYNWLSVHKREIVLIPIQINNNVGGTVDIAKFYNLLRRIDGFTNRMYELIDGQPWPTLRELVDNDQRILLFHYNAESTCFESGSNCPPKFHDWFAYAGETNFENNDFHADFVDDKMLACEVTRGKNPPTGFYALNLFMTIPNKNLAKNELNTEVFLKNHIDTCSRIVQTMVNIVFLDFWEIGNLPKVVQEQNQKLVEEANANADKDNNRRERKSFLRRYLSF